MANFFFLHKVCGDYVPSLANTNLFEIVYDDFSLVDLCIHSAIGHATKQLFTKFLISQP